MKRIASHDLKCFIISGDTGIEVARGFGEYVPAVARDFRRRKGGRAHDNVSLLNCIPLCMGEDHDRDILRGVFAGRLRKFDYESGTLLNYVILVIGLVMGVILPGVGDNGIHFPGLGRRKGKPIGRIPVDRILVDRILVDRILEDRILEDRILEDRILEDR